MAPTPTFLKQSIFADTFQRANENPLNATNWNTPNASDPLQVLGNQCAAVSLTDFFGIGQPKATYPTNHYLQVNFDVSKGSGVFSFVNLYINLDHFNPGPVPNNGFAIHFLPKNVIQIIAYVNGSPTTIYSNTTNANLVSPFTCGLGSYKNKLYIFVNGRVVAIVDATAFASVLTNTGNALLVSFDTTPADTSVINFDSGTFTAPEDFSVLGYNPDGTCNIIERWLISNLVVGQNDTKIFHYDNTNFFRRLAVSS